MSTTNTRILGARATVVMGMSMGMGCMVVLPDPNHCANLDGNETCAERYPGELTFCTACTFTSNGDGCVAERPEDDACYSPCGGETRFEDDATCLAGVSSSTGEEESTTTGEETIGTETGSGSSESSTTGPMPCVGNEDCPDAVAPFCEPVSGECVACDGTDDPDGACAGVDPGLPLCFGGACVACTPENPLVCDEQLLLCDGESNTCVPCVEHAECESGACELAVGRCFAPEVVVHVDGDGGQDFMNVAMAVGSIDNGMRGVIVVHAIDGAAPYTGAVLIDGGKAIALLAAAGEAPILQGTGGNPGVQVEGVGTILYIDGLGVVGNTMGLGLRVNGALAWVDRSRIVQNSGGGIVAEGGAELTLRNCFVGGSVNNIPALAVNGATATMVYVTVGAGFGTATALACDAVATVDARNSLFVSEDAGGDEVQCTNATIEHSAAELDLGGTNTALGDMATTWFLGYGTGDFHLATAPVTIGTSAQWESGDPSTDIDGQPRPAVDGATDYAGADVP
jgi:hypothetical protein